MTKWFDEIKLIFYDLNRMLQFSEFVWTPCYSVWDVFNNFFLIDATDRSKISSDQKRFFIALSLYPLSFFANTPFKKELFVFWGHLWTKVCGIIDFFFKRLCIKIKNHEIPSFAPLFAEPYLLGLEKQVSSKRHYRE